MAARADRGVYLEITDKKVFACAYDWPGLARSGRDEQTARSQLAAYAERYAPVPAAAGIRFEPARIAGADVAERLPGDATTAFGAPSQIPASDLEALGPDELEELLSLLAAAWAYFDRVVAAAPAELRKGPRGGGRDRDKIVAHVLAAEAGYSGYFGPKLREPDAADARAVADHRKAILDALRHAENVTRSPEGRRRMPPRYAIRRIAWHALDHAWEIEDRRE